MKLVICLSGGLDSAVLLADVKHRFPDAEIHAVSFSYGSKHNREEIWAARGIVEHYDVQWRVMDLNGAFSYTKSDLLLSGGKIPEGHYAAETMKATVVPGRNTVFAAVLLGYAQSIGASHVFMGIHAGDHAIYPDCRPGWVMWMREVCRASSEDKVELEAPFISVDKAEIVRKGIALGVPFEKTRTCYTDSPIACGRCGSCTERLEAFDANGAVDSLKYQSGRSST